MINSANFLTKISLLSLILGSWAQAETLVYKQTAADRAEFLEVRDNGSEQIDVLIVDTNSRTPLAELQMHSSRDDNFEPERNCAQEGEPVGETLLTCMMHHLGRSESGIYYPRVLKILTEEAIQITLSEIPSNLPRSARINFAVLESSSAGALDFAPRELREQGYYVIGGYVYNRMDAGNYLWARGMAKLGFSRLATKVGSQTYAIFMTMRLDDPADQRAIQRGYADQLQN